MIVTMIATITLLPLLSLSLVWLQVSINWSSIMEVLKIVVPVLGAWLAAHLSNKKEHRKFEESQQDKLTTGWSEMTAQSREIIARLQTEIGEMKICVTQAEEKAAKARQELDDLKDEMTELHRVFDQVKKDYSEAVKELESLRSK